MFGSIMKSVTVFLAFTTGFTTGFSQMLGGTKDVGGSEEFAQVLGVTIGSIYQAKQQQKQYEQSEKIRQHELELAKINSEAINNQLAMGSMYGGSQGGGAQGGMSLGAKIGIGVGITAVLGLVIFAIVRAAKK